MDFLEDVSAVVVGVTIGIELHNHRDSVVRAGSYIADFFAQEKPKAKPENLGSTSSKD